MHVTGIFNENLKKNLSKKLSKTYFTAFHKKIFIKDHGVTIWCKYPLCTKSTYTDVFMSFLIKGSLESLFYWFLILVINVFLFKTVQKAFTLEKH